MASLPRVAVIGPGGVGAYFGGMLARVDRNRRLNGTIVRRADEAGIPVAVNRALWALVRLRESR